MKRTLFELSFMALTTIGMAKSYAGNGAGNGGHVVVCDKNGEKTYTVLDHYEVKSGIYYYHNGKSFGELQFPSGVRTFQEKFENVLQTIASKDEGIVKSIEHEARRIFKAFEKFNAGEVLPFNHEGILISDLDLQIQNDEEDFGDTLIGKNCELKRVAKKYNQNTQETQLKKIEYHFNSHLLEKLDDNEKIYLIFHEAFYDLFQRVKKIENSRMARKSNAFYLGQNFNNISLAEYLDVYFKDFQLVPYEHNGSKIGYDYHALKIKNGNVYIPSEMKRFNYCKNIFVEKCKEMKQDYVQSYYVFEDRKDTFVRDLNEEKRINTSFHNTLIVPEAQLRFKLNKDKIKLVCGNNTYPFVQENGKLLARIPFNSHLSFNCKPFFISGINILSILAESYHEITLRRLDFETMNVTEEDLTIIEDRYFEISSYR